MKFFLLLTFICAFAIFSFGQGKKETGSLRLSFEMKTRNICVGDSADIIATVANTGKDPVVVDTNGIGATVYFDRFLNKNKKDLYGSFGIEEGAPSHYKPAFMVLRSGDTYVKDMKFVFSNKLFGKVGKYNMQIGYYSQSLQEGFGRHGI